MKNNTTIIIIICIAAMAAAVLAVNKMVINKFMQPAAQDSRTETKAPDDTVYTAEDIEQIAGTSMDSRDRTILSSEYKDYFLHSGVTPQNNYQLVHYMLFDSPETAREAFDKIKNDLYKEDSVKISDDFVSGTERDVMDADVDSCFLLRGNMLVSASAVYSNYYDINDEEKVQAHNAENKKNYEELKEWLKNEF